MLSELLTRSGFHVQIAMDGPSALELVRQFAPDLAILDIGLPFMNGYELATELRRLQGSNLRLIALTGYGQPQDRERATKVGFERFFVKPVEFETLRHTIAALRAS